MQSLFVDKSKAILVYIPSGHSVNWKHKWTDWSHHFHFTKILKKFKVCR